MENKMDCDKEKKDEKKKKEDEDIRIREFPDMRCLRKTYLSKGGKPVQVDSNDTPRHDVEEEEEDFGLKRSSDEEAWQFFCDTQADEKGDKEQRDELTEFLDDQ